MLDKVDSDMFIYCPVERNNKVYASSILLGRPLCADIGLIKKEVGYPKMYPIE